MTTTYEKQREYALDVYSELEIRDWGSLIASAQKNADNTALEHLGDMQDLAQVDSRFTTLQVELVHAKAQQYVNTLSVNQLIVFGCRFVQAVGVDWVDQNQAILSALPRGIAVAGVYQTFLHFAKFAIEERKGIIPDNATVIEKHIISGQRNRLDNLRTRMDEIRSVDGNVPDFQPVFQFVRELGKQRFPVPKAFIYHAVKGAYDGERKVVRFLKDRKDQPKIA